MSYGPLTNRIGRKQSVCYLRAIGSKMHVFEELPICNDLSAPGQLVHLYWRQRATEAFGVLRNSQETVKLHRSGL